MTTDNRSRRMDAARVRAELTVQDLWLRYVAIGGTSDAFELDGYLQGLVPLEGFQEDVLAQTLNEALEDDYRTYRVPLSVPPPGDGIEAGLRGLLDELAEGTAAPREGPDAPGPV